MLHSGQKNTFIRYLSFFLLFSGLILLYIGNYTREEKFNMKKDKQSKKIYKTKL